MVHAAIHAPLEQPVPVVPLESHIPDKTLDQVGHPPTPKYPVQEESIQFKRKQLSTGPLQPKPLVLEQPLPQALPMPRPMILPDTLPKIPDQPVPFQG